MKKLIPFTTNLSNSAIISYVITGCLIESDVTFPGNSIATKGDRVSIWLF